MAVLKIDGLGRSGHIDKVKAGQSALKIEKSVFVMIGVSKGS